MPTETGVVVGVVHDIKDPDKLGRVRVSLPHLGGELTYWARLVTLDAGPDRGSLLRPEVNDEVLVAFAHGDDHQPYVLGGLWNSEDTPPADDGSDKNHWRLFKSRSGHIIKLNDEPGKETVEVVDKTGGNSIIIDASQNSVTLAATGTVKIEAPSVEVTGDTEVKVSAPTVDISADGQLNLSGGIVTIAGNPINIG